MAYLFKIDLERVHMNNLSKILEGYKKAVEDNIWELMSFVAKNRRNLDFKECKRRCEILARSIDEYLNTVERAKELVAKRLGREGRCQTKRSG